MREEVYALGEERRSSGRYLLALRQHWPLIALIVLIAVVGAVAYSLSAPKRYEASADVLVAPVPAGSDIYAGIPLISESNTSQSVLTAARLVQTPQVAAGVKRLLHARQTRDELLASITVSPQQQSSILTITAQASGPAAATQLANAFARVLISQRTALFRQEVNATIDRLESRLRELGSSGANTQEAVAIAARLGGLRGLVGATDPTLQLVSNAVPPTSAAWPRPVLSVGVALAAALLLGIGVAIALELVNPLVLREEDLVLEHGLPVLAHIPAVSALDTRLYASGHVPMPENVREAYRRVGLALETTDPDRSMPRTILVVSAVRGEGRTSLASNLALAFAAAGRPAVLVDADLRHPHVADLFGVSEKARGLESALAGRGTLDKLLVAARAFPKSLRLLISRSEQGNMIDLMHSRAVEQVLDELEQRGDLVVIDSPPLIEYADALTIAGQVEAVLVAVRLRRSRRAKVAELQRIFAQRGIVPAGFVVLPRGLPWELGVEAFRKSAREASSPAPKPRESFAARAIKGLRVRVARISPEAGKVRERVARIVTAARRALAPAERS